MTSYATSPAEYGAVVSAAVEGVIKANDNSNQFFEIDEDSKNRIRDIAHKFVDGNLGDGTNMANLSVLVGAAVKEAVETVFETAWPAYMHTSESDYARPRYQDVYRNPAIEDYSLSAEYSGVVHAAVEGVIQATYDPSLDFEFNDDIVREAVRKAVGVFIGDGSNMLKLGVIVGTAVEAAFAAVIKDMKLQNDFMRDQRERKKPQ